MKISLLLRNVTNVGSKGAPSARTISNIDSFDSKKLTIRKTENPAQLPNDKDTIPFGSHFSDHMVSVNWSQDKGWATPKIAPLEPIKLHPAAKVFHYAVEVFEGMKAYYGVDGKVSTEIQWVPKSETSAFYIRPTLIGTEPSLGVAVSKAAKWFTIGCHVQGYFNNTSKGLSLLADPKHVRSWQGGVGAYKMGCNYAPTLYVAEHAAKENCHQVLWLSGEISVTEAGAMNLFMFWKNEQGEDEIITAPIEDGLLLPGITRQSVLELAREWNLFKVSERNYTMDEVRRASKENRIYEIFSSGTAAVVGPVSEIVYRDGQRNINEKLYIPTMESKSKLFIKFYDAITGIQYGKVAQDDWTLIVN